MHLTCTHSAVGLVSSHASFPICASSLPHDLPTIVSLVPAQQQWPNFQSQLSIFSSACGRLSSSSSFACGGPRRATFGQLFLGGVFLLHDSSRLARRTAKAWRLRPARGTAPRVSGSRQGVLRTGYRAMPSSPPPPPPPQAFASTCIQGTQRLRPCRRSEAAPLAALGLTTQAPLPFHGFGHRALCSLLSCALKI